MITDATERCEESRGGHGVCVEVRGHRHVKSSNETHADFQAPWAGSGTGRQPYTGRVNRSRKKR